MTPETTLITYFYTYTIGAKDTRHQECFQENKTEYHMHSHEYPWQNKSLNHYKVLILWTLTFRYGSDKVW